MSRTNEQACNMWVIYQTQMGYPALISREKTAKILGISKDSVKALIANGDLSVDKISNKVKLYSVAEFESR